MSLPICHTGGLPRRRHMVGQLEADGLEARFRTADSPFQNHCIACNLLTEI